MTDNRIVKRKRRNQKGKSEVKRKRRNKRGNPYIK